MSGSEITWISFFKKWKTFSKRNKLNLFFLWQIDNLTLLLEKFNMWVHLKVNSTIFSKDPYYITLRNLLLRKAWRYQRGQKSSFEERQTLQWPQDTKGVIRSRSSKKDRQCNGQKKKNKRTNNALEETSQKTID